jgi:hypothetical protein
MSLLQGGSFVDGLVLAQVGAVREAFATLIADVRLCSFVYIHMRCERRLDSEALAALWAHMLSCLRMGRLVILELLFGHEALAASGMSAYVRLVARMAVKVSSELGLVAKGLCLAASRPVTMVVSTRLAIEMLAGVVRRHMLVQIFRRGEVVVALDTVDGPVAAVSTSTIRRFTS